MTYNLLWGDVYNMKNKINIFELLPSTELYKQSSYMFFDIFDTYNLYPDIYKQVGTYIYNTYINDNLDLNVKNLSYEKVLTIYNQVVEYISNNYKYNTNQLLKDCILIITLVELERNNYKIDV